MTLTDIAAGTTVFVDATSSSSLSPVIPHMGLPVMPSLIGAKIRRSLRSLRPTFLVKSFIA